MGMALVVVVTIALIMPMVAHAMFTSVSNGLTDGSVSGNTITKAGGSVTVVGNGQVTTVSPNSNGYTVTTTTYNGNAQPVSQVVTTVGKAQQYAFTTYNTQTTITKTYTQYVYYTTVVTNTINNYLMPILQWTLTYVNIGSQQQPGYHSVGSGKLFLPGSGGNGGIFVPVFATEAIYAFNIAPSVKPQVTGWYVGSQSQSTTTSTSKSATPPQLTSIQDTVNTIQQLATVTIPNITKTTTYWNYNTNTQYVTNQPPSPFYYSPQDIAVAYLTGNLYETQAVSDLLHGNIIGAVQSFGTSLHYYLKGVGEQAYNFGAGVVNTLASFTYNSQNPQSIAHALSTGNILNAITTGASMVWNALTSGWSKAFGFG